MSDERRWVANCSCGEKRAGTRAELDAWAWGHDDSPWTRHIVTSLAFMENRELAERMADDVATASDGAAS